MGSMAHHILAAPWILWVSEYLESAVSVLISPLLLGGFSAPPKNNPIVLPCFTHENTPFYRRVFTGEILRIFPMLDRLLQGFPWTYPNHFPTFFNGIIIYKSPCLSHQNHRTPYLAYHYYPKDPSKIHYPMLIPHPSPIKNNTTSAAETPPWLDTTHRASLSQEPYT